MTSNIASVAVGFLEMKSEEFERQKSINLISEERDDIEKLGGFLDWCWKFYASKHSLGNLTKIPNSIQ